MEVPKSEGNTNDFVVEVRQNIEGDEFVSPDELGLEEVSATFDEAQENFASLESDTLKPTVEEQRDLSYKRSGDTKYWRERLKSLSLEVPEELVEIYNDFLAEKDQTYEQISKIFGLISKYRQSLKDKYGSMAIEPVQVLKKVTASPQPQKEAPSPVIEQKSVESKKADIVGNKPVVLEHISRPELSKQDEQDMRMQPGKGWVWVDYWVKRLLPEIDTLPLKLQKAIHSLADHDKTGNGRGVLGVYVRRRREIFQFRLDKKLEMNLLKKRLSDIDQRQDYSAGEMEGRLIISYEPESKALTVGQGEAKRTISIGDVAVDADWGIKYSPDETVPDDLWRKIRKVSDLREARKNIEGLFDRELQKVEHVVLGASSVGVEYFENNPAEGYIAEWMARGVLSRLQYNNPKLGLRVENANAIEDSELKYDFKVLLSAYVRGVAMEPEGMSRDEYKEAKRKIGIQFTVSLGGQGKERKTQKGRDRLGLNRYKHLVKHQVQDIVLVRIKLNAKEHLKRWLKEGKPPGGPEQYLTREQKIEILKKAVQGRLELSDADIEKLVI